MIRWVRLTQDEPYRMAGTNTLRAPVVTQTLKAPKPKKRLNRVIARG